MVEKIHLEEISSTNEYAVNNIHDIDDKTVVFADIQTKGKGRNGRSWFSEKNNLFASLVLKPKINFCDIYRINNLVHYTAVILSRVFKKKYNLNTKIKWPNDLLVEDKKIAGILIETVIKGDCLQGVVIGVGVNLNMNEESLKKIDKPAISLDALSGMEINRDSFLDFFIDEFFLQYDKFLKQGFSLIEKEYKLLSMVLGKRIKLVAPGKEYYGIAKRIDDKGQLILECYNREEIINIGDIIC